MPSQLLWCITSVNLKKKNKIKLRNKIQSHISYAIPNANRLHSFVKLTKMCNVHRKWPGNKSKRWKKKFAIELKYVWQHANTTTSAFCIVVDNRYSIPLPKRIPNILLYRQSDCLWLFVFSHPEIWLQKDEFNVAKVHMKPFYTLFRFIHIIFFWCCCWKNGEHNRWSVSKIKCTLSRTFCRNVTITILTMTSFVRSTH